MPTYEYRCEACLKEIEEFQSITAPALIECPFCKAQKLKRKIGGGQTLLRFNGKGFYATDATPESSTKAPGGCCPCGKNQSCSSS